jgi:hypothetical protein
MNPKDRNELLAEFLELRKRIPVLDDGTPTPDKFDVEVFLSQLAALRKRMTHLGEGAPRRSEDARSRFRDGTPVETEEDFEWAAVIDSLNALGNDLSAYNERKKAAMAATVLQIYYFAEEASRDPANAFLIGHLERLRAAYERDYGKPIPPKGEK